MGSVTIFCHLGDVELTWDDDQEPMVLKYIEQKLAEGVVFFLVERRGWLRRKTLVPTTDLDRMRKAKLVRMAEETELVNEGKAKLLRVEGSEDVLAGRLTDPKEIAQADTVAVKPIRAG